jgi:hypothetical protein
VTASKERRLPFVRLSYASNRTATGRRTATPARKAARYVAFGRDRQAETEGKQRGEWYGPDGQIHAHEEVLTWATAQARRYQYTFQALLSVPEGRLRATDYGRALHEARYIESWRLMSHEDTGHSHAHVLFFRDGRMDREVFADWHEQIRRQLATLEERHLGGEQAEEALQPGRDRERGEGLEWG